MAASVITEDFSATLDHGPSGDPGNTAITGQFTIDVDTATITAFDFLTPGGGVVDVLLALASRPGEVISFDLASTQLTTITHDGHSARPVWGPDGHRLAFDRPSTGSLANVVVMPLAADAAAAPLLPRDRVQNVEAWLPDGRSMIVSQV